ncbi:MAG: SGNH/GDSL hydrolase family protein [Kiritimatiellae bacterium]|nr:SGNH/GDSL hydrolase family protein [Kiritimatiellia bacterium]
MSTQINNGQKILFIGDSITDCGRRDSQRPLGGGYVKLFADLMIMREPAKRIAIINKGIGGDRVTGLRNRWTDDVLRQQPNWLSIKIGINDIHSHYRNEKDTAVTPGRYETAYREILERTRVALPKCRILLVDPFYISRDTAPNSPRKQILDLMPDYLAIVERLSRAFKTRHIKTHELFGRLLKYYEPDTFCAEPVHPNPTGHLVIAEAIYVALS